MYYYKCKEIWKCLRKFNFNFFGLNKACFCVKDGFFSNERKETQFLGWSLSLGLLTAELVVLQLYNAKHI